MIFWYMKWLLFDSPKIEDSWMLFFSLFVYQLLLKVTFLILKLEVTQAPLMVQT